MEGDPKELNAGDGLARVRRVFFLFLFLGEGWFLEFSQNSDGLNFFSIEVRIFSNEIKVLPSLVVVVQGRVSCSLIRHQSRLHAENQKMN